jgi:hypothetical protein
MNDARPRPAGTRDELRCRWLSHAAAAFDLMFHPDHQPDLVSFDQRERRALELGCDLSAWLLQQHANADPHARPSDQAPPACPRCGQPARRVHPPERAPEERPLTTLTGEVRLLREQWRCTSCRVVFFPPGPEAGPGHGGLQPRCPAPGRAPGR